MSRGSRYGSPSLSCPPAPHSHLVMGDCLTTHPHPMYRHRIKNVTAGWDLSPHPAQPSHLPRAFWDPKRGSDLSWVTQRAEPVLAQFSSQKFPMHVTEGRVLTTSRLRGRLLGALESPQGPSPEADNPAPTPSIPGPGSQPQERCSNLTSLKPWGPRCLPPAHRVWGAWGQIAHIPPLSYL